MNGRTNVTNSGNNIDVMEVPLDPVTNFVAEEGTGKVLLSWNDPKDKYATPEGEMAQDPQQLVSVWSHTIIIRKEGSDPVDENDGVVIVSSSVRNQYSSVQYTDSNVENGIEYHYGAFAINEDGIASGGVYISATPRVYDTILANNSWEQINEVCSLGIADSFWEIGDEHELTMDGTSYGAIIIDFNHDDLADGSGKASITFCSKDLININCRNEYTLYLSTQQRYAGSVLRTQIQTLIDNKMDDIMKSIVKSVNKMTGYYADQPSNFVYEAPTPAEHYNFPFSEVEVAGSHNHSGSAGEGYQYPYFATVGNRIKSYNSVVSTWMLRSSIGSYAGSGGYLIRQTEIYTDGTVVGPYIDDSGLETSVSWSENYQEGIIPVCFGFCIGKSTA